MKGEVTMRVNHTILNDKLIETPRGIRVRDNGKNSISFMSGKEVLITLKDANIILGACEFADLRISSRKDATGAEVAEIMRGMFIPVDTEDNGETAVVVSFNSDEIHRVHRSEIKKTWQAVYMFCYDLTDDGRKVNKETRILGFYRA